MSERDRADPAEHLQRLLGQLGREQPIARSAAAEREREARLAQNLDAELARLVAHKRQRRTWMIASLAAAAAVVLALGLPRPHDGGSLSITREPPRPAQTASPIAQAATKQTSAAPLSSSGEVMQRVPRLPVPLPSVSATTPSADPSAEPESTLAEENQLFKRAADETRSGDAEAALTTLDRLLRAYPKSPLAQTALVRKFRLLAKSGRADEAKREAERYLGLYPSGFALQEAEELAHSSPSMPAVPLPSASAGEP